MRWQQVAVIKKNNTMSVKQEILRCIEEKELKKVFLLTDSEWRKIYDSITTKYSNEKLSYNALWERLNHSVSSKDRFGWKTIVSLVGNSDCILLILTEQFGLRVPNGQVLSIILGDTWGYVFYVTNTNADYLMCFNDHDFVIGCGEAERWIMDYYNNATQPNNS
jgi:hypothetical protein